MGKIDKDPDEHETDTPDEDDELEDLRSEIIRDAVSDIFRDHPDDYIVKLEELGFEYHEDDDYEELEEQEARAENERQERLLAFFETGKGDIEDTLGDFCAERDADEPNYPLFRRYFKAGNKNLKALLLHGLDADPQRDDLLYDLAYFHGCNPLLKELVHYFIRACVAQQSLQTFSELAREFHLVTALDGFNGYQALREQFEPGSDKRKIVDYLITEDPRPPSKDVVRM